jgi:hypothetical protein
MAEENVTREPSVPELFDSVDENLNKAGAITQLLVMNPTGLTEGDCSWAIAAVRDLVYEAKSLAEDIQERFRDAKAAVTS